MAGRTRTTKKLAQRINLDYFKTLHGIPRWRRILSGVFVIAGSGVAWLACAWREARSHTTPARWDTRTRCSDKNAVPAMSRRPSFQKSATDQACLGCHDGPIHQADQTFTPTCSSCHVEHQGTLRLASTTDRACTQCHADLKTTQGAPKFAAEHYRIR